MSNTVSDYLQNIIGNAQSASELHDAGKKNPNCAWNDSDFKSNEARISFLNGQDAGKKSGS